jgi:hypothetical protein
MTSACELARDDVGHPNRLAFYTLRITIDDTMIDSDAAIGSALYSDLTGTLMLTGGVSGASLSYLGGVRLDIDDMEELNIQVTSTNVVPEPTRALLFGVGLLTFGRRFSNTYNGPLQTPDPNILWPRSSPG